MANLHSLDKRWIYASLFVVIVAGLLFPVHLPLSVSPQAKAFYDAIEAAPTDKLAIIGSDWSAATEGENMPQTRVIMTHLMRRHIRFAIMAFDAQSTTLAGALAADLGKHYDYRYGRDYVNWGFRADANSTLKALVQNIPETIKVDSVEHKPLESFPAMQGAHDIHDIGIICVATPSNTYRSWIQFVAGSTKAPYCVALTSVMAPESYSFLDSGQMRGMLFGIKGAAEYEKLLNDEGFTTRAMTPVSGALILLFIFIGLGNYGMIAARRAARSTVDTGQ